MQIYSVKTDGEDGVNVGERQSGLPYVGQTFECRHSGGHGL